MDQGIVTVGNNLSNVKDVGRIAVSVLFRDSLNVHFPFNSFSLVNVVNQVSGGVVRVGVKLCGLVIFQILYS